MTQKEQIREYLEKNKKISTWTAIQEFRITRLSEYIRQLRLDGYKIVDIWKKGNKNQYVEYTLVEELTPEFNNLVNENENHISM